MAFIGRLKIWKKLKNEVVFTFKVAKYTSSTSAILKQANINCFFFTTACQLTTEA